MDMKEKVSDRPDFITHNNTVYVRQNLLKYNCHLKDLEIKQLEAQNKALQARIDELMLEYCPQEMTDEQLKEYEKHQVQEDV